MPAPPALLGDWDELTPAWVSHLEAGGAFGEGRQQGRDALEDAPPPHSAAACLSVCLLLSPTQTSRLGSTRLEPAPCAQATSSSCPGPKSLPVFFSVGMCPGVKTT